MTVQQALAAGIATLKDANVEDPIRDARLLMAACLGIDVGRMTLHLYDSFEPKSEIAFFADISERANRKPMSHVLGYREFFGRRFEVTQDVLDPRGDTETLIEAAMGVPFENVLDLGTGSGCILITLLSEREDARGVGTDISIRALDVAHKNAKALHVFDRCAFVVSDWFNAADKTFDLLVSNPPYIAADEMAGLEHELSHEPRIALTDEGDGLSCYRIIADGAGAHLNAGGWLMVEIGPTQAGAVIAMFEAVGLQNVGVRHDLDGRDRVIVGQKPL